MHALTKSSILLLLLSLANADVSPRIIGGEEVAIEDVPYQAELDTALLGLFWKFSCGAAIVGPNSVITSASCVYTAKPENVRIRVGSSLINEGTAHKAVSITIHPDYVESKFDNDLAFLTVEPMFLFHSGVKAVPLATYEAKNGNNATVSGWGRTDADIDAPSDLLRKATVPVVDRAICAKNYAEVGNVTESMLCAGFEDKGGIDSCAGDTGGPLQIDDVLIGLVSWGYGCGKPLYPAVYTNIVYFREWIQNMIDNAM